jgi:hypothetical protein
VAVLVATAAVAGLLVAVASVVGAASDNTVAQDAAKNYDATRGPHRIVEAWGVDPASARPAFAVGGVSVSIAENAKAACLLREDGNDHCYSKTSIATGLGFSITNDCSAGGQHAMLVRGFAPEGATSVELVYSDGTVPLKAELEGSAFFLAATTPAKGDPYPLTIRYLDESGQQAKAEPIRGGADLCIDQS